MTRFPSRATCAWSCRSRSAPSPAGCASRSPRGSSRGTRTSTTRNEAAHAASHALANALPLLLLASHADVAVECFAAAPGRRAATPPSVRQAPRPVAIARARRAPRVPGAHEARARARRPRATAARSPRRLRAKELGVVDAETADLCLPVPSPSGCPGCTHYTSCDHYNDGLDKRGVVQRRSARPSASRRCQRELAAGHGPEPRRRVRERSSVLLVL